MKMNWDKIGMTASGICAVHCMLVPFLLVAFPFLTIEIVKSNSFEWAFIGISALIAFFAMFQGYVYHKKPVPYILAIVGFVVFAIAKSTHTHEHSHDFLGTSVIHVLAGLTIVLAHYLNHKFVKHVKCSCGHEHE